MTPQNKTQNAMYWLAALLTSLLLAAVASIMQQPTSDPINWRFVFNDVGTVLIALAPAVGAGLGLPRLGAEQRAQLVNEIGSDKATKVLEQAAAGGQVRPMTSTSTTMAGVDYSILADEIWARKRKEELLSGNVQQPIRQQNRSGGSSISPTPMHPRNVRADT